MPVNLPDNPNAETAQGPGPSGLEGYPLAVVPSPGSDPFPVTDQDLSLDVTFTAAGQEAILDLSGHSMAGIEANNNWGNGNITLQGRQGNLASEWETIEIFRPQNPIRFSSFAGVSSLSSWLGIVVGYKQIRIVAGAGWTGTASIKFFATKAFYEYHENTEVSVTGTTTRTTSGTDSFQITNRTAKGIEVYVRVNTVIGTVTWPTFTLSRNIGGNKIPIATAQKSGNIVGATAAKFLVAPGGAGGSWDGIFSFTPGKVTTVDITWTIPGGASVTYRFDIGIIN